MEEKIESEISASNIFEKEAKQLAEEYRQFRNKCEKALKAEPETEEYEEIENAIYVERKRRDEKISALAIYAFAQEPENFHLGRAVGEFGIERRTFLEEAYLYLDHIMTTAGEKRVSGWRLLEAIGNQLGENKWAKEMAEIYGKPE